jgi:glycosyltransferase involved in cell wall biosynthesis
VTSLAFHVDQLFYPNPGGIGTYVRRLVPELAVADPALEIALFHARFDGAPKRERWLRAFWTEELAHGMRALYPAWALSGRPHLPISLSGRDLLHAPSPSAVPPKGHRQRLVVSVHDVAFLSEPDAFPFRWRLLFGAGLRRAIRTADAIVAVSQHTANELAARAGADRSRMHVTPLAPSLPEGDTDVGAARSRYGIPPGYFLYNGAIEPRKNLVRLAAAYRRIAEQTGKALVLAGPNGWRSDAMIAEARRIGAPGRIITTGFVPVEDLDALFRGASAFVYPSLSEGFGLPVLDAMARGVPCVVSNTSSLPEVAGDAALLVDPLDEEALAKALLLVVTESEVAASLSAAGRRRATAFTWQRTAEATLEVYRSVLEQRPGR